MSNKATAVNANKHLLVLNILSIKYSMYDVKCDVIYCVYTYCPNRRRIRIPVETDAEKRNLGQMCHALVCRRTEPAGSTMPLISLELSDTES